MITLLRSVIEVYESNSVFLKIYFCSGMFPSIVLVVGLVCFSSPFRLP